MVEKWMPTLPFVSVFFARLGQVVGTPENCRKLLSSGEAILVLPEGVRGLNKLWRERYQLADFGLGFMRLALETDTPIVPLAVVGAEEQAPALLNLKPVARLLHMPAMPITPTLLPFPLPTRYHLRFGEPLHFTVGEDGAVEALIAAPFDDADSLRVTLRQTDAAGASETLQVALPVARGDYRSEQLRVPAKYAEPDSASAERIRSEVELAKSVSRRAHDTPKAWSRPFRPPRPGRVTSAFGTAREFNGVVSSRHMGTDFSGAAGAPVYAANTGVVALTGDFYLAGKVVYLDHGSGLVTGYFHLSRIEVEPGALVQRGQRIGRVGKSGRVTGPHLHWIARYGAVTVDPMSVVSVTRNQ
jgi:murein DD-endopeptidase MepM/ murein hydrolase activator NlpD